MPTSHPFQLNEIVNLTNLLRPNSVMEIGIGFGKYGLLLREYLEIWGDGEVYHEWLRRIDGIEIFESYVMDHHRAIYNNIYIGSALDILPKRGAYDLILLIDVLEHIEEEPGKHLLSVCKEKAKHVIVSTPKDIGNQGEGYGNIYESHLSQWSRKSLKKQLGRDLLFISNPHSHLCLWSDKNTIYNISKTLNKEKISFPIKKHLFPIYKFFKPKVD